MADDQPTIEPSRETLEKSMRPLTDFYLRTIDHFEELHTVLVRWWELSPEKRQRIVDLTWRE